MDVNAVDNHFKLLMYCSVSELQADILRIKDGEAFISRKLLTFMDSREEDTPFIFFDRSDNEFALCFRSFVSTEIIAIKTPLQLFCYALL